MTKTENLTDAAVRQQLMDANGVAPAGMPLPPMAVLSGDTTAPATADRAAIGQFLRLLWPEGPRQMWLCVCHHGGPSQWFGGAASDDASVAAPEAAADYIATRPTNAFVGMCLAGADHGGQKRLRRPEVTA